MHAALLTALLFALTGVCATQSSRLLGAARANAWRLAVALAMLALWAHLFGAGLGGGVFGWLALAGGIGFGLGGWCMFHALRRIGSTLSLLIVECAAAVIASVIGWVWFGAALTTREMGFAALILVGVIAGASPGPIPNLSRRQVLGGCSLAMVAALFQAISFNISSHAFRLVRETGGSLDALSAAYQRLIGGAVVAISIYALFRWLGQARSASQSDKARELARAQSPLPAPAWVALNALFGPVLGVTCMLWAIRVVDNPGLVQAVVATSTLITIPFARALEKARPGLAYYIGCLLALSGVAGLLWEFAG
ncbi:MAG: hypothetical protein EA425_12400 [Puniceicoccaceae bacterium]|nr:MAG: hypothetical protein EA425_12400 [Puniceicoccaceae bacterium]